MQFKRIFAAAVLLASAQGLLAQAPATAPVSSEQAIAAERSIVAQAIVPAGVADVYSAWTSSEGIKSFFAPNAIIDPVPGGLFEIQISPESPAGMRGADDMRYLALQAPRMVSFTWNAPPSLPEARKQRTFVVLRFAALPEANGKPQTLVRLTHSGWGDGGEWDRAFAYFSRAWPNVLGNLKRRFETGPIDWTEWLAQLRAAAQPRSAASAPVVPVSK
jgi:uncharacterized protein YndB with AHSA1/START domain